jgi:hypothetical protein
MRKAGAMAIRRSLYEGRLDNVVDAGMIGIGERVDICTKMGVHVATGEVSANNPFGLALREGGFYDRDLYLFAPLEERHRVRLANELTDSPDDRVADRLRGMGETAPVYEAEKLDDKDAKRGSRPTKDDGDDEPVVDDKTPIAKPESSVEVDKLPEDIKKAVVSTTQMNEGQLNSVLSEIGDITVKSLKRANVKDTEIYSVASQVQQAVYKILTGKQSAPPAPPKKSKG